MGGGPAGADRRRYVDATLVLYDGATQSGCGGARAQMGPFYCPLDKKVYLDLSFFRDMQTKYGGGGDFAYAYVIAHEVGHHVQDLLGILDKVRAAEQGASQTRRNALSVRVELMADCLAGVWAANANRSGGSSTPATSRRRWRPPRRSATTGCRRRRRARRARQFHPRLVGDAGEVAGDWAAKRPGRFVRHLPAVGGARRQRRRSSKTGGRGKLEIMHVSPESCSGILVFAESGIGA